MKAAVIFEHGGLDVVGVADDLPVPEPGPGEARLRIHAAALNRLDVWVRAGWPGLKLAMPHVLCADGAGVVDVVGPGVKGVAAGDRVCIDPTIVPPDAPRNGWENQGHIQILSEDVPGVAAEYVVLPARNLLRMPDYVSFADAAAAGLVYVTAWHSLMTRGDLNAGESVLIVGAGGGVNTASIQIAKYAGATVYVVGSNADKCEQAQALGADFAINRAETPDWSREVYMMTGKRGVDVVVDNVGQATLNDSIRAACSGGRILIVGSTTGPKVEIDLRYVFRKHLSIIGSTMGPHQDYVKVMNLVFDGKLKPVVGATFPLAEVHEAMRRLEQFEAFGKVVLEL